jgi:hypothetical protein
MLTEDKKTNLKKPNKEKLLDMLNIPFIKPNKTEYNKKSKIRPPFMKHKKSDSSDDSSSSSDSDSSSDKHKINNIEIIYNGTTYIFDNGNLYNKTNNLRLQI